MFMLFIMNTWKILQRRTYDILSHKYSLLIILLAFTTIFVSIIQFGEVWMIWSQEKYDAVFNSFSDNVIGKSLQQKLCQSVPIDVVYTWVNGSDPILLKQLDSFRDKLQEETSKQCPYKDCVPSNYAAFRGWEPGTHTGWRKVQVPNADPNQHPFNWTVLEFMSPDEAMRASRFRLNVGRANVTLFHAHWSTESSAHNALPTETTVAVSGFPAPALTKYADALFWILVRDLGIEVRKEVVHGPRGVIVVHLPNKEATDRVLKLYAGNMTVAGHTVCLSRAFLVLELPSLGDPKDFSPSRFEDKEELRYSLRSLELFAPWVRHVYLVTNGQIPYWLNLDNPRLTIVTHRDIFPDLTHLPTFSSPAIESHLHRIPGLSHKFLYLNDDVMFGREVWPDDFITHANGQKIYFSWSVPDCSDSCPWSWVGDGSCDMSCNTSDCSFDGGDCDDPLAAQDGPFYDDHHLEPPIDDTFENPLDFALGEDEHVFDRLEMESRLRNKTETEDVDQDVILGQLEALGADSFRDGDVFYQRKDSNRNPHRDSDMKTVIQNDQELVSKEIPRDAGESIREVRLDPEEDRGDSTTTPRLRSKAALTTEVKRNISLPLPTSNRSVVVNSVERTTETTISALNYNKTNINKQMNSVILRSLRSYNKDNDDATHAVVNFKGNDEYLNSERKLSDFKPIAKEVFANQGIKLKPKKDGRKFRFKKYLSHMGMNDTTSDTNHSVGIKKRDVHIDMESGDSVRTLKIKRLSPYGLQYGTASAKKPRDTFAESLLYVNRLYNREFGFEARKVPAHMPHLVDREVMEDLQSRFHKEWDITSSHKVRSPTDMQFAFSYFYFLMSEKESRQLSDIFDDFDTDRTGTWSDREIRTLLTRAYELPLSYNRVVQFEEQVCNCSRQQGEPSPLVSTPPYERYQDSKLPLVTKRLVLGCRPITLLLEEKFGRHKKYRTEVVKERHQDVTFKMLSSNLSQLVSLLDDVRKEPKKFICLNDNLDPGREKDNTVARAVLQDFYESLFPIVSTFELPPEFRNRFLHVEELQAWRASRGIARTAIYICLAALVAFTAINLCQIECRPFHRRYLNTLRHRCQEV